MQKLLERYRAQAPEIVFEWRDTETEAVGWVVINSLRNGAAGGGTRMRKGLTRQEVAALAKVMEIKFSISGPPIGGAKSGINFDPEDPGRDGVLRRWYRAVFPLLKTYYGTGGDLNVDEIRDVIPITEALGLWHPQEGIVNGHFNSSPGEKVHIIGQLRHGVSKIVEDPAYVPDDPRKFAVSDMITGYGLAESIRHYYDLFHGRSLEGKTAIIQGWGNVASAAASYLTLHGAKIKGVIDLGGGILSPGGLGIEAVKRLFVLKQKNKLEAEQLLPFGETNRRIWDLGADIFVPGAASRLVSRQQIDRMIRGGLEVMACGANVPFVDDEIFLGPTAIYTDQQVSLIPDFIANCGMARVFAYFMQPGAEMTDQAIFTDVSQTIRKALAKLKDQPESPRMLTQSALRLAMGKLLTEEVIKR